MTALKSIAFRELPEDLIARADLRFTYVLSALRATATNLKYLATLLRSYSPEPGPLTALPTSPEASP